MNSIGAIIGDIAGSIYEFNNHRSKDFPLFGAEAEYTDDSIMTTATMSALLSGGSHDDFIDAYKQLGNEYPSSYGTRFSHWLMADDPKPYDSWGNGAPMRVSPVAWFYDRLEDVERMAKVSAEVTHNHPEGVKGAQSIAGAVFLARTGKSKQDIKEYIEKRHGYFLDFKLDDIRQSYQFDESSAGTVPPAVVAFLESTDFEDAIRNAISIGGDSDTVAAITGSIAEAFYGVPSDIEDRALKYLPAKLFSIVQKFNGAITPILAVAKFQTLPDADVESLRSLSARIRSFGGNWGVYQQSEGVEPDADALPWIEQSELIQEFVRFMYDKDLIINFDWNSWQEGREWLALEDEAKYDELDIQTALKLLTAVIRSERFDEGVLVRAFEDGLFPKIIEKLITI